jgi:hypothetical protein
MPFSNYTIDPQQVEALRSAFQKVCLALGLNCKAGDAMTEIIVGKIMDIHLRASIDIRTLRNDQPCSWWRKAVFGQSEHSNIRNQPGSVTSGIAVTKTIGRPHFSQCGCSGGNDPPPGGGAWWSVIDLVRGSWVTSSAARCETLGDQGIT